jgi:alkanesulfonate monooxygenase SsuD/methylene tetrahydromethanopterin reductase-like flavin-dependent oxidoreductase (luciferase family)
VTYEGQYNHLTNVRLEVEPYQRPYPPLWYPTSNPDTIPWVAENGYQLLLSFNTPTLEENRRRIGLYREALPRARTNPSRVNAHVRQPYYGVVRKVYVAETDAEARRVAREALDVFRHNFTFLLSPDRPTHYQEEHLRDLERCMENGVLFVGSPATVRERLLRFMEGCGGNYFGGVFAWGSLTDDQVMRSLDLFTRDVLPALRGRAVARA